MAESFCVLGATDAELAERFGVSSETIYQWKKKYPAFARAIHDGREGIDERVARSLAHRAIGYSHPEEVLHFDKDKSGRVKVHRAKTVKQYPPNEAAAKFWLTNRRASLDAQEARGNAWREKVEHTGEGGGPIDLTVSLIKGAKKG